MFWICTGRPQSLGQTGWKPIGLLWKERRTVTRHSSLSFATKKKKKKKMCCFWPHPWSAENIMSKVASAFLHLTETNPQEGLSGPPSLCGGYSLSTCLCGFPLGVHVSPCCPNIWKFGWLKIPCSPNTWMKMCLITSENGTVDLFGCLCETGSGVSLVCCVVCAWFVPLLGWKYKFQ